MIEGNKMYMIDTPDSQSSSAQGHQEVYQASAP